MIDLVEAAALRRVEEQLAEAFRELPRPKASRKRADRINHERCSACGHVGVEARGLCHRCYERARTSRSARRAA